MTRRQRAITWAAAGLSLVFIVLAGWAVWSREQARASANLAAAREVEARAAQSEAIAAKVEIERLTRSVRADQLTANALKVAHASPPLALLLAAEGLRAESDFTTTVVIREPPMLQINVPITRTSVVSESVVASAQANVRELLGQVGGVPLAGHEQPVTAVAFSPDGRWLATGRR